MLLSGRLSSIMSTIQPSTEKGGSVSTFQARKSFVRAGLSTVAILVLAACGGGSNSTGGGLGSGDLLVGVIAPFTGADAGLGPAYYSACLAAAPSINANGGVGGRKVKCQQFDTRGEPADAFPAANAMIASHSSNLMAVVGCTSDEAATVAPVIDRAHIPMFCMTGQSEFNKTSLKYFHRLVPADIFDAYAMVGSALYGPDHTPYKRAALVFGNDIGSQAFVQPATNAFTKLVGTLAINQPITLAASSYRTRVAARIGMPALAMVATNSPEPKVYNSKIKEIANGVSGATVVNTYKDGVAALKAGKSIRFVGAGGENNFDQYNNSVSGYILVKYDAQGNEVRVAQLTPDQTKAISDAGGI